MIVWSHSSTSRWALKPQSFFRKGPQMVRNKDRTGWSKGRRAEKVPKGKYLLARGEGGQKGLDWSVGSHDPRNPFAGEGIEIWEGQEKTKFRSMDKGGVKIRRRRA